MLWGIVGALLVMLAAAAAFAWYAPDIRQLLSREMTARADRPRSFGCKMTWIAVQTRDTTRIIQTLRLRDARSVNWGDGLAEVYNQPNASRRIFVTPPIDGWSFIVGLSLPHPLGRGYDDRCSAVLMELCEEFGEAHYYASYPALNFFSWILMHHGGLRRGFAIGENGVIWNKGAVTDAERRLDVPLFQLRVVGERNELADALVYRERDVHAIAAQWSIDPSTIDERDDLENGLGYLATAHANWQTMPARQAA